MIPVLHVSVVLHIIVILLCYYIYRYWEIVLRIDIQFCERSCPTSVEQVIY